VKWWRGMWKTSARLAAARRYLSHETSVHGSIQSCQVLYDAKASQRPVNEDALFYLHSCSLMHTLDVICSVVVT